MNAKPKVLAFAGSTRGDSFNKKLVRIAARGAEKAGATCTVIDLRDFPMPIYDGDLEAAEGLPKHAKRLRDLLISPGGLGGLRGLVHLRAILGNIGCLVVPDQFALRGAHKAFDESGELADPKQAAQAEQIGAVVAEMAGKLG
ncbi:MAG: NAD(P)H-dependent oxidoreductase [Deltaproteobacteria bacterium]|nr:NAD(P)H-dependent oxidoreductase [Deltaproteobacteria bacterium]